MFPAWVLAVLATAPAVCNAADSTAGGGLALPRFLAQLPPQIANLSVPDAAGSKSKPKQLKARTGSYHSGDSIFCDNNLPACAKEPWHWPSPFVYLPDSIGHTYRGSSELIGSQWQDITYLSEGKSDGWSKLTLPFPIKIFEKSQREIYVSIDGFVSFEPFCHLKTTPNKPLPVPPPHYGQQTTLPKHTIAPLWSDYWIPPSANDFVTYGQVWTPNERGRNVRVAAIDWFVHSRQLTGGDNSATTWIEAFWREDRPSAVCFSYGFLDRYSVRGTIGVQSYPKRLKYQFRRTPPVGQILAINSVLMDTETGRVHQLDTVGCFGPWPR
ncbi:hypothetical protein TWF696_001421 [Orbilia brochopaga]|uniref:Uncharacterized protein n=1 Tax=Orbilia brochopaga TaxID=3140254 RepID=A0AAV9U9E8_9PEZI